MWMYETPEASLETILTSLQKNLSISIFYSVLSSASVKAKGKRKNCKEIKNNYFSYLLVCGKLLQDVMVEWFVIACISVGWAVLRLLTHYLVFLPLLCSAESTAEVGVTNAQEPDLNDCTRMLLKPEPAMPVLGCWLSSPPDSGLVGSGRCSKTSLSFWRGLIVIPNPFV